MNGINKTHCTIFIKNSTAHVQKCKIISGHSLQQMSNVSRKCGLGLLVTAGKNKLYSITKFAITKHIFSGTYCMYILSKILFSVCFILF